MVFVQTVVLNAHFPEKTRIRDGGEKGPCQIQLLAWL